MFRAAFTGLQATRRLSETSDVKDKTPGIDKGMLVRLLDGNPLFFRCDGAAAVQTVKGFFLFSLLLLQSRRRSL